MHQSEVEVDIFIHLLLLVQMLERSIVCLKQRETEERKVLSYRNRRKRDPFCLFVMENVLQQSRELFSCFKIPFLETPKILDLRTMHSKI